LAKRSPPSGDQGRNAVVLHNLDGHAVMVKMTGA